MKSVSLIPDRFSDVHVTSQYSRIKDPNLFDFVGRYENLEEDWAYVSKKLHLGKLPHKNKTNTSKKWQDYYTLKTAKLVHKRYKKDFDTWYPDAYGELKEYLKTR